MVVAASSRSKFAAVGLSVGAHALALGVVAYHVAPPREGGGAPVITLDMVEAPRFDSDRAGASNETSGAQASPSSATAAGRRPAPIRVRRQTTPPMPPEESVPALPFAGTASSAPEPEPVSEAAVRPGPVSPASTPSAAGERSVAAGGTTGGGARTLGAAGAASVDPYAARVLAWIEKHKRHPGGGGAGTVTVGFVLDRRGGVLDVRLVRGSGRPELDRAALSQIRTTQPFPRPAPGTTWRKRGFDVQIQYRVL